jgi:hypothetical protein
MTRRRASKGGEGEDAVRIRLFVVALRYASEGQRRARVPQWTSWASGCTRPAEGASQSDESRVNSSATVGTVSGGI